MRSQSAGSDVDLALELPPGPGRRTALEAALRDAIRVGRLRAGTVLPSSRALAADLHVARGTVTAAYEQLVSEGWLVTRPGSSTAVADGPTRVADVPLAHSRPRHDFHIGLPALDSFPRRAWTEAMRRALDKRPDGDIWCHDVQGDPELRVRLAEHLGRSRGLMADPDDLVICSGFTQAHALTSTVLRQRGAEAVAVEEPSHPSYRQAPVAAGFEVIPVPVHEHGLRVDMIPSHVDAISVTPCHHFPLGVALSNERRHRLVAHAAKHGALVVEDDYFGELRHEGAPLVALQPLDPHRVVHANSVGKSLTPGLRLGWLVAPPGMRSELVEAKRVADKGTSALEQITFSELIASGAYARHVRSQRTRDRRRRDHLVGVIERDVPRVHVRPLAAGLYVLVELPPDASDEQEVIADAASQGIRLISIRDSWRHRPAPNLLAVGFTAPPDHDFRAAVERLAAVLATHTTSR